MKYVVLLLMLLIYSKASFSQALADKLRFYLIDTEDGLSNNTINSFAQDSVGFVWIGTTEGLNRYDGRHFTVYRNELNDSSSLSYNYIQQMYASGDGKLWISTDGGLDIYDTHTETYRHYNQEHGLVDNSVNSVIAGPDSTMIIGVYRGGIHLLDANGKFAYLRHESDNPFSLSSDEISCIAMQGDTILWAGTYDGGLNKVRLKDRKVTRIPFGRENTFTSVTVNALYIDFEGNVWVGTKEGMHVITAKGDTLSMSSSSIEEEGLSDDEVLCFQEDGMGNIWIGTRNGGLNIINIQSFLEQPTNTPCQWFLARDDGESVYNRTVSAIMRDRAGDMWIGTSTGVNFVNPRGENIIRITRNPASAQTLMHNRISALEKGDDGKIWVGTDGGGLDLFDPKTGKYQHFYHNNTDTLSLSNDYVLSLKQDSKGRLWAGTYQGGINHMDRANKTFRHYLQGEISNGSDVRCILEDADETIWVGTNRGGLYYYRESTDSFIFVDTLGHIDIRDILQTSDGGLWLATFGSGIYYYHPKNNIIKIYNTSNTPGLPTDIIFCLAQTQPDEIWAGTRYGGLIKLHIASGKISTYTEKDGLSNNTINSIIPDNNNKLWLGTSSGITRFCLSTKKISSMVPFKNLQYDEFNIGAALRTDNGSLYFGSNKGLITFDANKVLTPQPASPIILTGLRVFNKSVTVASDDDKSLLDRALFYKDTLVLNYNHTLFSIDYNALKYPFSEDVSYTYKLENYDNQWIEAGNAGTANFSNIPPGEYVFKVKTNSIFGENGQVSKALTIIITPPFWKTWPAYVIYVFACCAIFYGASKYYAGRIKLKNSLLFEKKQRQLEHTINEERLRFFTSFSHELKTPLTLILAPIEDMLHQPNPHKGLKMVYKNAQFLLQLINKLLELRKSETGLNQLNIGQYDIHILLSNWTESYQSLANHKKVRLSYQTAEGSTFIWCDEEKMHIVVNNLLSNALKFTQKGGEVSVRLFTNHSHVFIEVKDNGIGISEKVLSNIFHWYFSADQVKKAQGTGIGLALSKKLVELHHGEITVDSQLQKGSSFLVSIPLHKEQSHANNTVCDQENIPIPEQSFLLPEGEFAISSEVYDQRVIHTSESKEVILLIDDHPDIIQYLKGLLSEDYHIISAEDGQKGLKKACHYIPDLIISDIMMPAKNGIDLCKALKQTVATTHIPVVLLSAKDSVDSYKAGFEEGADAYITKPFNSQLLLIRIRSLLKQREQLRKYFSNQGTSEVSNKEANSPLFRREKRFLEDLENAIYSKLESNNTNVEEIAQMMGMSRTSLYRKIKSLTGKNINEYIRMVKLNKAVKLMKEDGLPVSQAAFQVGFNNLKYFRKLFKEQFGKLPSEVVEINDEA